MHKLNYDAGKLDTRPDRLSREEASRARSEGLSTGYVFHDIAVLKYLFYFGHCARARPRRWDKERVNRSNARFSASAILATAKQTKRFKVSA